MFDNIIIIGLGLIGGSLAKKCKKQNIIEKILAFDNNNNSLKYALKNNIIDQQFNFDKKIPNKSIVVICSPLHTYQEIFIKLKTIIVDDTIIIDFGSVKQKTTEIADKILKHQAQQFIPCHPIAGSEKFGIENADNNLFHKKPIHIYENKTHKTLRNFLEKVGFIISSFPKNNSELIKHDQRYCAISHLPQLISFLLAENITTENNEIQKHLRLQNSNKNLWRDIFAFNADFLRKDLEKFKKNLEEILQNLKINKGIFIPIDNKKIKILKDFNDLDMMYIFLIKSSIIQKIGIENIDNKILKGTGFNDFTFISIYSSYIAKTLRNNPEKFNKDKIVKKLENYTKSLCLAKFPTFI